MRQKKNKSIGKEKEPKELKKVKKELEVDRELSDYLGYNSDHDLIGEGNEDKDSEGS